MSIGLYLILIIFFLLILLMVMVAKSSNRNEVFSDINVEEWICSNCGFEVQAGDNCIYCGKSKE